MKVRRALLVWIVMILAIVVVQTTEGAPKKRPLMSPKREAQARIYQDKAKAFDKKVELGRKILNGTYKDPNDKVGLDALAGAVAPGPAVAFNGSADALIMPIWVYPIGGVSLVMVGLVLGRRTLTSYSNPIQSDEILIDLTVEPLFDGSSLGLRSWDEKPKENWVAEVPRILQSTQEVCLPVPAIIDPTQVAFKPFQGLGIEIVAIGDGDEDYLGSFLAEPAAASAPQVSQAPAEMLSQQSTGQNGAVH